MGEGLAAAHRAGVIHRDLKSANVMIVPEPGHDEPRVVVTDFGLARASIFSDYLVSGSYAAVGAPKTRQLRLDVQVREPLGGNVLATFAETGTEEGIFELVSRAGSRLRETLGVASVSPKAASGILASLPSNPRAVRHYAEGLASIRASGARRERRAMRPTP